jgi:hypothetical protein
MQKASKFEVISATIPAPEPKEYEDDPFNIAAGMVREVIRLLADVATPDYVNGMIVLNRMAGLSLAETGSKLGMSKQAVHKRIIAIITKWPQLADALTDRAPLDEDMTGKIQVLKTMEEDNKIRQEVTRWMNRPN